MAEGRSIRRERERLGPLPILNHFIERLGLDALLEELVPAGDRSRTRVPPARALGVLLRSILVEREPIYRQEECVRSFSPRLFGLGPKEYEGLSDDCVGRALTRLFTADHRSLLTECILRVRKRFGVSLDEVHTDSTTIRLCGQYRLARGRSIRGKRAPWITYGHSKERRGDLKQLLVTLTATRDGVVPVYLRTDDGNRSDSHTHLETWETLCEAQGGPDFLYVADSKLCSEGNLQTIHDRGGRFVTVLPRSRREDRQFRQWIQETEPPWEKVRDRPNPRQRRGPRDIWYVHRPMVNSRENWPITWVFSTLLKFHQERRRQENIARAIQDLEGLKAKLDGPRSRYRSQPLIEEKLREILMRRRVQDYVRPWVYDTLVEKFRQERSGRPGRETRYIRTIRKKYSISWEVDEKAIEYDRKSDGMYPLLTNDRSLTPAQVLDAHKRQAGIERRFRQAKSIREIAPVLLHNEGRIVALFVVYFLALMVEGLVEREVRRAMSANGVRSLPLYPEGRRSKLPTANSILRLFTLVDRESILEDDKVIAEFGPDLGELQLQVLSLLGIPAAAYKGD